MNAERKPVDDAEALYMRQYVSDRMANVYEAFSGPVDVRRVLDHHAADYTRKYGPDNEFVLARDAFNDLAEVCKRLDHAFAHPEGGTSAHDVVALRAALVRCGVQS